VVCARIDTGIVGGPVERIRGATLMVIVVAACGTGRFPQLYSYAAACSSSLTLEVGSSAVGVER
jgi:hypothetical protein